MSAPSLPICRCGHSGPDHGMLGICTVGDCDCVSFTPPRHDFHCHVCGKETDTAPDPPALTVCEEHCPDHDYRYERELRGHYCLTCGKERSADYDDGGF